MTRLAARRDTHLTREEIAAEALRQFDDGRSPSIRGLAAALGVAPTAIYHHYRSRAEIVDAAVQLVWQEATAEGLRLVPEPFAADPVDLLVAAGVAVRRAFGAHHRLAPHLAATPRSDELLVSNLGLLAGAFEGLGLTGEEAAAAFHAYGTHMIGAVLFAAGRHAGGAGARPERPANAGTHGAIDEILDLSFTDPARDEELFALGLRRLILAYARQI